MSSATTNTNAAINPTGASTPVPRKAFPRAMTSECNRDAVLAGLRLLQEALQSGVVRPHEGWIGNILTNGGQHDGLDAAGIDELCEAFVTGAAA